MAAALVLGALVSIPIVVQLASPPPPPDPAAYSRLGMEGPIRVVAGWTYLDGGSIAVVLEDARGRRHQYVLEGGAEDERTEHLHRGENFPRGPDLEEFPWGGQEEADLASILEPWIAENVPVHRRISLWHLIDDTSEDPAPKVVHLRNRLRARVDDAGR